MTNTPPRPQHPSQKPPDTSPSGSPSHDAIPALPPEEPWAVRILTDKPRHFDRDEASPKKAAKGYRRKVASANTISERTTVRQNRIAKHLNLTNADNVRLRVRQYRLTREEQVEARTGLREEMENFQIPELTLFRGGSMPAQSTVVPKRLTSKKPGQTTSWHSTNATILRGSGASITPLYPPFQMMKKNRPLNLKLSDAPGFLSQTKNSPVRGLGHLGQSRRWAR